jgi:predicted phosphodiesterase
VRVAALYDVHGNLPALEAVLEEVDQEQPDAIVVGGDMVSGPMPSETLERLRGLDRVKFLRGNADRVVVEVKRGERIQGLPDDVLAEIAWITEQLTGGQIDFLAHLPQTITLDVDGLGPVCFCHATPRDDDEIFTKRTPDDVVAEILAGTSEATVVCGHTHVQVDRRIARWRVVNAGSVGMPYEDVPGARWALLGPDVDLRRSPYEVEEAAERVRASGWRGADEFVDKYLFAPPSADEASEYFERMAAASRTR